MNKVMSKVAKIIFLVFGVAVMGLLMSLTYEALGRIFPKSLVNQIWGMVLFDIAAICWALAFAYASGTTTQYAVSAVGFMIAFMGTLVMVAAEVILSGQSFIATNSKIGQWLIYGFIVTTTAHTTLLYTFHFTSFNLMQQIEIGIAQGEVMTASIKAAVNQLSSNQDNLAAPMRDEIVRSVQRNTSSSEIMVDPAVGFVSKDKPNPAHVPFTQRLKTFWKNRADVPIVTTALTQGVTDDAATVTGPANNPPTEPDVTPN